MRHLESVHTNTGCGVRQNVTVTDASPHLQPLPGSTHPAAQSSVASDDEASRANRGRTQCENAATSVELWASGSIDVDDENERFATRGLTVGADAKIAEGLIVGAAAGFGQDKADIGLAGTRNQIAGRSITGYVSARPDQSIFIDALIGYSDLTMETRRSIDEGEALNGGRDGSAVYASLSLGTKVDVGALSLSPYLRNDHVFIKLDELLEEAASALAVSMESESRHANVVVAGGKAEIAIPVGAGTVSPNLRLEYRNRTWSGYSQDLAYRDTPLERSMISEATGSDSQISASFGLRINFRTFDLEGEYGTSTNTLRSFDGSSLRISGRIKF
jgi:uncharacterized protein with beta-barrel porin domain